jgi:hypothetical protein
MDRSVHMSLSSKVDEVGDAILLDDFAQEWKIANISLDKSIAGGILKIGFEIEEVLGVAGVSKFVKIDHFDMWVGFEHVANEVGANKTGASADQEFHRRVCIFRREFVAIV